MEPKRRMRLWAFLVLWSLGFLFAASFLPLWRTHIPDKWTISENNTPVVLWSAPLHLAENINTTLFVFAIGVVVGAGVWWTIRARDAFETKQHEMKRNGS